MAEAPSSRAAAARVVEAPGVKMDRPVAELWLSDDDRQVLLCAARHAALVLRTTLADLRQRVEAEGVAEVAEWSIRFAWTRWVPTDVVAG